MPDLGPAPNAPERASDAPRGSFASRPRRLGAGPMGASLGFHLLVAGLLALLAVQAPGSQKPKAVPPSAVPVTLLTPPPPKPSALPSFRGDLAVKAKATPAPTPRPTPEATPTPRPTPRPRASAKPKPRRTPRPTPRPRATPRPRVVPRSQKLTQQQQFKEMRKIPYFSKMTDAQLRKQKLPPGMKDWRELGEMGKKLDGLNWLFLPPPTTSEAPTPGQEGDPTASASTAPQPLPSATESVGPNGVHTLDFTQGDTQFHVVRHEGFHDAQVTVTDPDGAKRVFTVPYSEDREKFMGDIVAGSISSLFGGDAGGSPAPAASSKP